VIRGATQIATGAEIHPHTVIVDSVVGAGASVGALLLPLRPGTVATAILGGHLRGDQEFAHRRPHGRSRISPTSGMRRSARTRTSAPERSPRTSPTSRASPRAAPRSAATSGPVSTMASSRRWRWETERGSLQDQ
jgi:hypothetical protein